jgi:hypothetical protein
VDGRRWAVDGGERMFEQPPTSSVYGGLGQGVKGAKEDGMDCRL